MTKINCYRCNETITEDWLEVSHNPSDKYSNECFECFQKDQKMKEWERSQMHPSELLEDY